MSERFRNKITELSGLASLVAIVLTPLLTYAVVQATNGERLATLQTEVADLKLKRDTDSKWREEVLGRLIRIETKLER